MSNIYLWTWADQSRLELQTENIWRQDEQLRRLGFYADAFWKGEKAFRIGYHLNCEC